MVTPGLSEAEPLVPLLPSMPPPETVQPVALVELQSNVVNSPSVMVVGVAVSVAVGAGAGAAFTVTVTLSLALPPSQFRV